MPDGADSPSSTFTAQMPGVVTYQRATAIVYCIALFMSVMDMQIVNVALPKMAVDFNVALPAMQWVVTAYMMSIAVFVAASGWLGDRFGNKRMFLTAVGVFTAASALCAVSSTLSELVATRVLQGIGGGMMLPLGLAMLYRAYPPADRVSVTRVITAVMVIAPASAPLIGGSLVTWTSWRWIFIINVPVGILALLLGLRFLREHRESRPGTFDRWGAVLGGVGLGLAMFSVGSGPELGWGSATVIGTALLAAISLYLFISVELRRESPLLDLRLLSERLFRRNCLVTMFLLPTFFGTLVFTTLYLQAGRGVSAIQAGLSTFPEAIAIGVTAQLVGRLYPHVGPRRLMAGGFVGLAVVCALLARAGANANLWEIRTLCFFLGVAACFIFLPNQTSAFARISSRDIGHASAIYFTIQRAAGSIGIALLSAVLAIAGGNVVHGRVPISAFEWVFFTSALLALGGVAVALRVQDADAVSTMRPMRQPAASAGME